MKVFVVARVILFGDLICAGLENAGYTLAGRFGSIEEVPDLNPDDALVVHVSSAGSDTIRRLRSIKRQSPRSPVIVLCPKEVKHELRAEPGTLVNAIIPDDLHLDVLISSLNIASNGYSVLHNSQIASAGQSAAAETDEKPDITDPVKRLSKREVAILAKLLDGFANKEIATQLRISDSTVKVHLRSIFQKTGVKNRTQAAIWANKYLC